MGTLMTVRTKARCRELRNVLITMKATVGNGRKGRIPTKVRQLAFEAGYDMLCFEGYWCGYRTYLPDFEGSAIHFAGLSVPVLYDERYDIARWATDDEAELYREAFYTVPQE
jgi:hypothetical protein